MCEAFSGHPAIVGWQIDHEIAAYDGGCFCPLCKAKFKEYLKIKYKTIENLNKTWGARRWSLDYLSFDDVIPPRYDTWNHPSLLIEWERFQSDNISEYVDEQAQIIKKYFKVPFGTDMMPTLDQDYRRTLKNLDIVQFNHYDNKDELYRPSFWFDFLRTFKDKPFWNTETQTVFNGGTTATSGYRPYGNCYVNTMLPFLKGGEMNMYWLFRAHFAGHELGHGAVLTSSGRFYHTKREIKRVADDLKKSFALFKDIKYRSDIALHYSTDSNRNLKFAPLVEGTNYFDIISNTYHRTLCHYNEDVIDTDHTLKDYKVVFSPFLTYISEELKEKIKDFVNGGGVWIAGPMTDVFNDCACKYQDTPFGFLEEFAGIYTEFHYPVPCDVFKAELNDGEEIDISHCFDGYTLKGAASLARYTNDWPKGLCCIAEKKVGKGKVIVLGTLLKGKDLLRFIPFAPIKEASENVELMERGKYIIHAELEGKEGYIFFDGKYKDLLSDNTASGKYTVSPLTVGIWEKIED